MKNIVLVGLMGAGKTSVGKNLSTMLNYKFIDTDKYIENEENQTINEIFSEKGEKYFRELECKTCKNLSMLNNLVISTGGGTIQNLKNLHELQKNSFVVYLQASPQCLYERIKNDNNRPLLQNNNPLVTLAALLQERENNYKLANFVINTENITIADITSKIIKEYHGNN